MRHRRQERGKTRSERSKLASDGSRKKGAMKPGHLMEYDDGYAVVLWLVLRISNHVTLGTFVEGLCLQYDNATIYSNASFTNLKIGRSFLSWDKSDLVVNSKRLR